MENSRYREYAKVVAYVDLVFTSIGLLFAVLIAIGAGVATAVVVTDPELSEKLEQAIRKSSDINPSGNEDIGKTIIGVTGIIIWIAVALTAICSIIEMWAAVKLLNSTDIGRELAEALKMSAIWRNVTIVMMVISCALYLLAGIYIGFAIVLLLRGFFLFVVYQFRTELENNLLRPTLPFSVSVK